MGRAAGSLDVRDASRLFKALGGESRLRIVALLSHGELCVCHLQEALGLSQPSVSRQLAVLRAAGVVEDRRERKWVYYRLARQPDEDCERHLRGIMKAYAKREVLRKNVEKLLRTRGPGACA
jgi:ArsR family transcriptional regulator, arsenate/arsenite/antimonite-responsive transcriptional repressor